MSDKTCLVSFYLLPIKVLITVQMLSSFYQYIPKVYIWNIWGKTGTSERDWSEGMWGLKVALMCSKKEEAHN